MADIEQIISDFTSKLKPLTSKMVETGVIAEEEPSAPPEEVLTPVLKAVSEGAPCVTTKFKAMVKALDSGFVGNDGNEIKDLVVAFLDSLPACLN